MSSKSFVKTKLEGKNEILTLKEARRYKRWASAVITSGMRSIVVLVCIVVF